ncbi:unnamed protein product [Ostreobium quekettii]|uniref:Uncharacterized protein n=1 Tax=Ostreobium quekettii TaxID=121088 RepID=A0A8S1JD85_9CHLO|nr:unnamed protein product [Ostreobium quekettii]
MTDAGSDGPGLQNVVMEEFMRCSLPPPVLNTLHNAGVQPHEVLSALYPEHVAAQVLEHLSNPGAFARRDSLPRPSTEQTSFPFRFRDDAVESQFLQWETSYMKWHLIGYSLFLFGLLGVHLNICNPEPHPEPNTCACSFLQQPWPCGSRQILALGFVLIWMPIACSALPQPYNYKYRELMCATHQLMACYLVSSFTDQVAALHIGTTWRILDPLFFCVVPILIESIGAKVLKALDRGMMIFVHIADSGHTARSVEHCADAIYHLAMVFNRAGFQIDAIL